MYRIKVQFIGDGQYTDEHVEFDTGSLVTDVPTRQDEWIGVVVAIGGAFLNDEYRDYLRDFI